MGWTYCIAESGEQAMRLLNAEIFEVAIVDVMLPGLSGIEFLEQVKQKKIHTEIVIVAAINSIQMAVSAIKTGAYDYITIPFLDQMHVDHVVENAVKHYQMAEKLRVLEKTGTDKRCFENLIGKNKQMQDVFRIVDNIAATNSPVLITGENGTGKELIARAIHNLSPRKDCPFITVNCSAIPKEFLDGELFGYKKEANSDILERKSGFFENANKGSIFLDDIASLPDTIQAKVLRLLQNGEIRPEHSIHARQLDVRIIAASNRQLIQLVEKKQFREDLFYRINIVDIDMPALRSRVEDIPLLAYHFLRKYKHQMNKPVFRISPDALQALQSYSWPGNVRELENTIERAVVMAQSENITIQNLPQTILDKVYYLDKSSVSENIAKYTYKDAKQRALTTFNRAYIISMLQDVKGNISAASLHANMDRSNFKKLMNRYDIDAEDFKGIKK